MKHADLPTVLACGAWLKNTACLLMRGEPVWSIDHGDLSDPVACQALTTSVRDLVQKSGNSLRAIAHDLHPDFFSTRLAIDLAAELEIPSVGVQHHLAHIAAVIAENATQPFMDEPVVGLALDGVGLGTDGMAWGGELLWVDGGNWERLGHLMPLSLPGGDKAAREPWRVAASVLHELGRSDEIVPRFGPLVGEDVAKGVQQMLVRGLNCPRTSSTGRWFDAASAALGMCLHQTDEAQAAIALETAANRWLDAWPDTVPISGAVIDDESRLDLRQLLARLLDAQVGDAGALAAGFHLALADALSEWAGLAAETRGVQAVCLGGGCFFNRILRERVVSRLEARGMRVALPGPHGFGDAGLALGQAWVVARQLVELNERYVLTEDIETCA